MALYSDWRRREVPCYLFSLAQQLFSEHHPFDSLFLSLSSPSLSALTHDDNLMDLKQPVSFNVCWKGTCNTLNLLAPFCWDFEGRLKIHYLLNLKFH